MKELKIKTRDGAEISLLYFASDVKNAPLIFDIHGGGYTSGEAKGDEELCRALAKECGACVATVDYRFAPKVRYPKATDDCKDALLYLIGNEEFDFDRERIFLLGHSAGGNAVVAVSAELSHLIAGQILDYPWLDVRLERRKPYIMYSIPAFVINGMSRSYFRDEDRERHDASAVLMTADEVKRMPKTLLITCGRDTLKYDGEAFKKLLSKVGVPTKHKEYPDAVHGFVEIYFSGRMKSQFWLGKSLIKKNEELAWDFIREVKAFIEDASSAN